MTNKEFQNGAFAGADAKFGNVPSQRGGVERGRGPLVGIQHAGNDEIGIDSLVNDDICSAGFRNVGGKFRKQLFQLCRIRRDRYMGSVRVGGPFVQCVDVESVGADKADAIDNDPLCSCLRCDRSGRSTGGRVSVCKHDHNLGIAGLRVKQLRCLSKGIRMIGVSACA